MNNNLLSGATIDDTNNISDEPAVKKIKKRYSSDSQCEELLDSPADKSSVFTLEEKGSVQEEKPVEQMSKEKPYLDPDFVQIVASKKEVQLSK